MFKSLNRILSSTVIMVMVMILCIFYMYLVISPIFDLNRNIDKSEKTYEYMLNENDNLKQTLEMINDENTRQRMARELYQLSDEKDVLFKFPESHPDE